MIHIKKSNDVKEIRNEIIQIKEKGNYVLMVGTIEPRKNHKYVIKAFEKQLFEDGVNLIFAGRIGWNVQEFVSYVKDHEQIISYFLLMMLMTVR